MLSSSDSESRALSESTAAAEETATASGGGVAAVVSVNASWTLSAALAGFSSLHGTTETC